MRFFFVFWPKSVQNRGRRIEAQSVFYIERTVKKNNTIVYITLIQLSFKTIGWLVVLGLTAL